MIKFRNTRTGREVELDEADPRVVELDRGKRWERVGEPADEAGPGVVGDGAPGPHRLARPGDDPPDDNPPETPQRVEPSDPPDAMVRAWARENDIEVPSRGRLSPALVDAFKAAQA